MSGNTRPGEWSMRYMYLKMYLKMYHDMHVRIRACKYATVFVY